MLRNILVLVLLSPFVMATYAFAGDTQLVFVDKDNASGNQDGLSWATAFRDLQPAIDSGYAKVSTNTDVSRAEVWVADGIYDEERTTSKSANDSASLFLQSDVFVFGGFEGGETRRDERDPSLNTTTIVAPVEPDPGNPDIPIMIVGAERTQLDGFKLECGRLDDAATEGGIVITLSDGDESMVVANCVITNLGGTSGVFSVSAAKLIVNHCRIFGNGFDGSVIADVSICSAFNDAYVELNDSFIYNNDTSKIVSARDSTVVLDRTIIRDNGGYLLFGHRGPVPVPTSVLFQNCLIEANRTSLMLEDGIRPSFLNSTIVNNSGPAGGVPYEIVDPMPAGAMTNCIVWGNTFGFLERLISESTYEVSYTNLSSEFSKIGEGNISIDPEFVDPINGDFRLSISSPSVDTGSNDAAPSVDIVGTMRPQGDGVDMGAYEHAITFDTNGDGQADSTDIQAVINAVLFGPTVMTDVNLDLIVDAVDIQLVINRVLGLI